MAKILIVEDDLTAAGMVQQWLGAERYIVEIAVDGDDGLEHLRMNEYDVILLDCDLPGMSGNELLKRYRTSGGAAPVIMLTARTKVEDKEDSLDGGADDYITKPYSLKELSARIRVQLRKSSGQQTNELKVRELVLIPDQLRVTKNGKDIELLPREFALLEFFMRNPDKVFSADAIMSRVWNAEAEASTNAFRSALTRLRQKIDTSNGEAEIIETVHGAGYRFNSRA